MDVLGVQALVPPGGQMDVILPGTPEKQVHSIGPGSWSVETDYMQGYKWPVAELPRLSL